MSIEEAFYPQERAGVYVSGCGKEAECFFFMDPGFDICWLTAVVVVSVVSFLRFIS